MTIGIVVEGHHTEHLQVILEILEELNQEVIIYNCSDTYGNMDALQARFRFDKRDIGYLKIDKPCYKYIVVSNTNDFYKLFKNNLGYKNVIYIAHIESEKRHLELDNDVTMFSLSKSVLGESRFIFSISRNPSTSIQLANLETESLSLINVVKLGWVTKDRDGYIRLLNTRRIHLHVFTISLTPILVSLLEEYQGYITVYIKMSSDFINDYITRNNIKFVYFNPESVELFSGSITFAINNSMILLSNDKVADLYKIPSEYILSINNDNFVENMANAKVYANQEALEKFRMDTFLDNLGKFKLLLYGGNRVYYFSENIFYKLQL